VTLVSSSHEYILLTSSRSITHFALIKHAQLLVGTLRAQKLNLLPQAEILADTSKTVTRATVKIKANHPFDLLLQRADETAADSLHSLAKLRTANNHRNNNYAQNSIGNPPAPPPKKNARD